MKKESLQEYLREHIPIIKAMGVAVVEAGPNRVILSAPLPPNINHMKTVFGGSAAAVATLSAWALLYFRLRDEGIRSNIVIHKCAVTFDRPIVDTFTSTTLHDDDSSWKAFVSTLGKKGRARIRLVSTLECNGAVVGELAGEFVSIIRG